MEEHTSSVARRRITRSDLRVHRKKSGLSQREVGLILGFVDPWHISKLELAENMPSLTVALGYEILFRVPVGMLFRVDHNAIMQSIERNLLVLEQELRLQHSAMNRRTADKLRWLAARNASDKANG